MIIPVDADNIVSAGLVHSVAWRASHSSFCTEDFLALHTPEHQSEYFRQKMAEGSRVFLLMEELPVGVVSVTGNLIEDLYILPEYQNQGQGTALLHFAITQCEGMPTLWILENNKRAERLYLRMGFRPTGRISSITEELSEIEYALCE